MVLSCRREEIIYDNPKMMMTDPVVLQSYSEMKAELSEGKFKVEVR